METSKNFTCISYDTIEFLIQSQYVIFGIYLGNKTIGKNVNFEKELLPHISLGNYLEESFLCQHNEECNVMLVMKKDDFDLEVQKMIVEYTETEFPVSGNFALSVNTSVTSKIMDISLLRLIPNGIRLKLKEYGVSAIAFADKRQILISPDNFLRFFLRGEKC